MIQKRVKSKILLIEILLTEEPLYLDAPSKLKYTNIIMNA